MIMCVFHFISPGVAHGLAALSVFDHGVLLSVCVVGGRAVDGHGEGEAGAGVHES